jgi:hypothetical protein
MLQTYAKPSFGGRARPLEWYTEVSGIIATLRDTASQATIADHLNKSGFSTPRGRPWNRESVANYLRNTAV